MTEPAVAVQARSGGAAGREKRSEQRYPCVGIALMYSAVQNGHVAGLGRALHDAAMTEMSLHGLSFDVGQPLVTGQTLILLVEQPDGAARERLTTEVRWCEPRDGDHYRVGVRIVAAALTRHDDPDAHDDRPIGVGPAWPVGAELLCPACRKQAMFSLVGQQAVGWPGSVIPLYDCGACGTTRSITSVLAHARQQAVAADCGRSFSNAPTFASIQPAGRSIMNPLQRIFYVEDEPDIQAVARLALEMVGGFTVKVCSSGEEALREAEAFAPDLILLDVMMPGMDGPSTLKALRERPSLADVPVAFMTAKVQPAEVAHYKSLGALDVIPKPFDPMALAGQVRAIWEARRDR